MGDHVDHVRRQWAEARPDLDTAPVAVAARVGQLARYLDAGIEATLAEHGLNRASFDVLASLRRSGRPYRLSPTELYRSLMRSSGAMTNRLRNLERAGLVAREPDPRDRRSVLVRLTPEGRSVVDRAGAAHLANERRMLAPLTAGEQEALAALLHKLLLAFEAEQPVPPAGPDAAS